MAFITPETQNRQQIIAKQYQAMWNFFGGENPELAFKGYELYPGATYGVVISRKSHGNRNVSDSKVIFVSNGVTYEYEEYECMGLSTVEFSNPTHVWETELNYRCEPEYELIFQKVIKVILGYPNEFQ